MLLAESKRGVQTVLCFFELALYVFDVRVTHEARRTVTGGRHSMFALIQHDVSLVVAFPADVHDWESVHDLIRLVFDGQGLALVFLAHVFTVSG